MQGVREEIGTSCRFKRQLRDRELCSLPIDAQAEMHAIAEFALVGRASGRAASPGIEAGHDDFLRRHVRLRVELLRARGAIRSQIVKKRVDGIGFARRHRTASRMRWAHPRRHIDDRGIGRADHSEQQCCRQKLDFVRITKRSPSRSAPFRRSESTKITCSFNGLHWSASKACIMTTAFCPCAFCRAISPPRAPCRRRERRACRCDRRRAFWSTIPTQNRDVRRRRRSPGFPACRPSH